MFIEPQILPHEAKARESAEAEPTYPAVDSVEDRKHHQVSSHSSHVLVLLAWNWGLSRNLLYEKIKRETGQEKSRDEGRIQEFCERVALVEVVRLNHRAAELHSTKSLTE